MDSIFNEEIEVAFSTAFREGGTQWCINELEDEKYNLNRHMFTSKDITQILAHYNDFHLRENGYTGNGCNIDLFGKLNNSLYFYLTAWCDYTGWDCQSGGSITVSNYKENLITFAMDNEVRERLNLKL